MISRYPVQYGELFLKAALALTDITIEVPNRRQAQRLRADLHAYRRAFREDEAATTTNPDLALLIDTVGIKLRQSTGRAYTLIMFRKKVTEPLTIYIDKALSETTE